MIEKGKYTGQLFVRNCTETRCKGVSEKYAKFFSKIFSGVKNLRVENSWSMILHDIVKLTHGKCKTLGEMFAKAKKLGYEIRCINGLTRLLVKGKNNMDNFTLHIWQKDNKFKAEYINWGRISYDITNLSEREYQDRYVKEMTKIFGKEYTKHCEAIEKEDNKKISQEKTK